MWTPTTARAAFRPGVTALEPPPAESHARGTAEANTTAPPFPVTVSAPVASAFTARPFETVNPRSSLAASAFAAPRAFFTIKASSTPPATVAVTCRSTPGATSRYSALAPSSCGTGSCEGQESESEPADVEITANAPPPPPDNRTFAPADRGENDPSPLRTSDASAETQPDPAAAQRACP